MATIVGKILRGVLTGGGSILAAIAPFGTIGKSIGAAAIQAGKLFAKDKSAQVKSSDSIVTTIDDKLGKLGLLQPIPPLPPTIGLSAQYPINPFILISVAAGLLLLLILKKKR